MHRKIFDTQKISKDTLKLGNIFSNKNHQITG